MANSRIAYTVGVKLRAIEYAEMFGNAETGRTLGISESCIRRWRIHKDMLKTIAPGKRTRRGGRAKNPILEQKLKAWVMGQLELIQPVTMIMLRFKATALAKQLSATNFSASRDWAKGFMRRNGFCSRELGKGVETVELRITDASGNMLDVFADDEPQVFDYRPNVVIEPEPEPETEMQPAPPDSTETRCESSELADKFLLLKQRSVGFTPKSAGRARHLHTKFKALEKNILGTSTSDVEEQLGNAVCDLCDQSFECTVEDGPKSIRDLVCKDCLDALRNVRQQEQPHQQLESRLDALESLVAALNESAIITRTAPVKKSISSAKLGRAELLKENAELRRRLMQYEKAEREQARENAKDLRVTLVKLKSPAPTRVNPSRSKPMPASKKFDSRKEAVKKKPSWKLAKVSPKSKVVIKEPLNSSAEPSGEFRCFVCENSFKTKTQMQGHIESEHSKKNSYPCPACSKRFPSLSTLQRHCQVHPGFANVFSDEEASDTAGDSEPVASTSDHSSQIRTNPKQCQGCRKRFSSVSCLERHAKTCTPVQNALGLENPTSYLEMECEEELDVQESDSEETGFVDLNELSEPGPVDDVQDLPGCEAVSLISHLNGFMDSSRHEDQSEHIEIKMEAPDSDMYCD